MFMQRIKRIDLIFISLILVFKNNKTKYFKMHYICKVENCILLLKFQYTIYKNQ